MICIPQIIQNPGEFVISFSGAYHQGFNLGLNLAEAVNFGTRRWLNFVTKFEMCQCQNKEKQLDRFTLAHLQEIASSHLQSTDKVSKNQLIKYVQFHISMKIIKMYFLFSNIRFSLNVYDAIAATKVRKV